MGTLRPAVCSLVAGFSAFVSGACSTQAPSTLTVVQEELASPAGPRSGEPFLSTDGDIVYLSWLEAVDDERHELRFSGLRDERWSEPATVARSDRFFVNWADFPSLRPGPRGTLWAHYLERDGKGTYAYGVRVVRSDDGGETWSEPIVPHDDRSATEHGFVSAVPRDGGVGFVWLDGRKYAPAEDGSEPSNEMTLRYRVIGADGAVGEEMLVDGRVCDCCQTATTLTSEGPVTVYRDRSEEEIRDIYVTRLVDGAWTEGAPVHRDGWEIAGCPVNGPAIAARGTEVAVAWFAAPDDVPRVKVAFSADGGASFGEPVVVDDGNPAGRVDLLLDEEGNALVTWLERTGGEAAEVRLRRVGPGGGSTESVAVVESSESRASGFPRLTSPEPGTVILAWTDLDREAPRVKVVRLRLGRAQ